MFTYYSWDVWERRFHSEIEFTNIRFPSSKHWRAWKTTKHRSFSTSVWEKSSREITWLSCYHRFKKLCFARFICTCTNVYYSYFPISDQFYSVNVLTNETQSVRPMNRVSFPSNNAQPTLSQKNFKTEVSLWKPIKCFSFTFSRRTLNKATMIGHIELVLQEILGSEIIWLSCSCRFEKFFFERFISNEVWQMFSIVIFPCLICFTLFETNETQSVRPCNEWCLACPSTNNDPSTLRQRDLKTAAYSFWKRMKCFSSTLRARGRNLKKSNNHCWWLEFVRQEILGSKIAHGYRFVAVSKSFLLRGLFRVQMLVTSIFPHTSVVSASLL